MVSRIDDVVWTSTIPSCNESWRRTALAESSEMAAMQGFQRSKRQNCGALVQDHGNSVSGIYGSRVGSVSSRTNMEIEGRPGCCPGPVFTSFQGAMDHGNRKSNLDFFQPGSAGPGTSSSSSFAPSWMTGNTNVGPLMQYEGGPLGVRFDVRSSVSTSHSAQSADLSSMMTYGNADGLRSFGSLGEHSGRSEATFLGANTIKGHSAGDGRRGLDPSMCTYSSQLPGSEGRTTRFPANSSVGSPMNNPDDLQAHTSSGRTSCKRKSSMAGITGFLPFRSSRRWESNFSRATKGSGPSRSDTGNSMATDFDVFHNATSGPMNPNWDEPHYLRDGDITLQPLRGNQALQGSTGNSRYVRGRPLQQEHNQSQVHPLVMQDSRMSVASVPSQTWMPRRIQTNEQVMEFPANVNNAVLPDNWTLNHSSSTSVAGTWSGNNAYPGTGINQSTLLGPAGEIVSGIFEGNQTRNPSNGAPSWFGITTLDLQLPNQASFDPAGRAISTVPSRALNIREPHGHLSQVGAPFSYPGSVAARPSAHISTSVLSRHGIFSSQGRGPPPALSSASNNIMPGPQAASVDTYPSSAPVRGPGPSSMPSLFLDRPAGDGGQASSMQNVFRMPFRGLQILPAEQGNHQRFISEELLDQSMVYNGVDTHDQHSDMRLDVDNMSYEELLALEERIGNVNTGLSDDNIAKCLKTSTHSSLNATIAAVSQESEIKCSICQEEYMEEDELGKLDCGHCYHTACIKQWLVQKNQCPICKAAAYAES